MTGDDTMIESQNEWQICTISANYNVKNERKGREREKEREEDEEKNLEKIDRRIKKKREERKEKKRQENTGFQKVGKGRR